MKTITQIRFLPVLLLLACASPAWGGAPPEVLSYQGFLVDADGVPLGTDGAGNPQPANYDVTFSIFDASSDGNLLWAEQQTITVDNGYFSVLLGEGAEIGDPRPNLSTIFTGFNAAERFIGVAVRFDPGSDVYEDILPRLRLLTSPYAFLSSQTRSVVNDEGQSLVTTNGEHVTIAGILSADTIVGSGGNLTDLDASKIISGTLDQERLPASISGNKTFTDSVGIGTASPIAPLEVRGSRSLNRNFSYFARGTTTIGFNTVNVNIGSASGTVPYSIIAQHRIGATEFNAFSDARIKQVVGRSDPRSDTDVIRRLRVTDYLPADTIGDGAIGRKGFIAQEVREIIPEAVTLSTGFVPDVYALPATFEHDAATGSVTVTMVDPHGLDTADRVRIFADAETLELEVVAVESPTTFTLGFCEAAPARMFVYGREVSDFHILNYDRIFTSGIGAIQELLREVDALKSRMDELERQQHRLNAMEAELAQLRTIVRAMAGDHPLERAGLAPDAGTDGDHQVNWANR